MLENADNMEMVMVYHRNKEYLQRYELMSLVGDYSMFPSYHDGEVWNGLGKLY